MVDFLKVKNRAVSKLASGVTSGETVWNVITGEGAKFPSVYPFHITCEDEIVSCSSRAADALTVIRSQEGTNPSAHVAGKDVELRITAAIIQEIQDYLNAYQPDLFAKYLDFVPLNVHDTDAWTKTIDGIGFIKNLGIAIQLATDNQSGEKAFMVSGESHSKLLKPGCLLTFEWLVRFIDITNATAYLIFIYDDSILPDMSYAHFGFKIINGRVWATTSDDSTQKLTDTGVDLPVGWQWARLKVVVAYDVDVKFYVNGVLKATHTTNLPIDDDYYMEMGIITTTNFNRSMVLGRCLLQREYS